MMSKRVWMVWIGAMALALAVSNAEAKPKWHTAGEYAAGKDAKEVPINHQISEVQIACIEGSVIINTIVVREGSKTTPIRVAARLNKGDTHVVRVGDKINVSGLRISDDGRGRYVVRARQ